MKKGLILILSVGILVAFNSGEKVYATSINEGVVGFSRLINNISIEDIKEAMINSRWTTNVVNLRTKPDIDSDSQMLIEKREKVEVISIYSNWTKVTYKNYIGWIRSDFLRDTELPSLEFTDEEIELITKIVWLEARNQPDEGLAAIILVIRNRVSSKAFSDSVYEVLSDTNQFSTWKLLDTAEPTEREYEIYNEVTKGLWNGLLTQDYVYFSTSPANNRGTIKIGDHFFCKE